MGIATVKRLRIGEFVLLVLFSTATLASYEITDLGFAGVEDSNISKINLAPHAYDVNNSGEVAGRYGNGFLWRGAHLTGIIDNEWNESIASATNKSGQLALNGPPLGESSGMTPYVWDKQTGLSEPVVLPGSGNAFVRDINDNKILVGNYQESSSYPWLPYIWYPNGQALNLEGLGGKNGVATAINNAETMQVVGTAQAEDGRYHAFLWTDGSGDDAGIQPLKGPDERGSVATALNDDGHVVGWVGAAPSHVFNSKHYSLIFQNKILFPGYYKGYRSSYTSRAVLWSNNGWKFLGKLVTDDRANSAAYDINNSGQVVGFFETDDGDYHAFLYTDKDGMVDLNTLLPNGSGWELQLAHAISDNGQIVGWGVLNGQRRAFLLTPAGLSNPIDISINHSYRPLSPRLGEVFTVTTTISNEGSETLTVHLQQIIAPELMLESISGYCTQNDNTLSCDLGDMADSDSITIEHVAKSNNSGRFLLKSTATGTALNLVKDIAVTTTMIPITRQDSDTSTTYEIKQLNGLAFAHDEGPRINKWGDVVFSSKEYVYSGGEGKVIGNWNHTHSDLNDSGDIVGYIGFDEKKAHLYREGEWLFFKALLESSGQSEAKAVNNHGLVVGFDPINRQAFSVMRDSDPTPLGDLGNDVSEGYDVNDLGWIVGYSPLGTGADHAFLYRNDLDDPFMEDLGTLGGNISYAYAINNKNIIVGASHTDDGRLRAARFEFVNGVGQWTALGELENELESRAYGINELNVAVGSAKLTDESSKAVHYKGKQAEDLNSYLPRNSSWQLSSASGINDKGEIVGIGTLGGDSWRRAFLMSPLVSPPLFSERQTLNVSNNDSTRYVGSVVAIDGNTLAIGSPLDAQHGENAGAVFIYEHKDGAWTFRRKLLAKDGKTGDTFGRAVALSSEQLVVGSSGKSYVFEGSGSVWQPVENTASLTLDISGVFHDGQTFKGGSGRVSIYDNVGEVLEHRQTIEGWGRSGGLERGRFGDSLALYDDLLVVGAPTTKKTNGIEESGVVYVYRKRDDGKWVQYARLLSSGRTDSRKPGGYWLSAEEGEQFGSSVDIHWDLIVVGAPNGNEGEHGTGAVYVFQRQGNHWFEEIKLTTPNPLVNQKFGASVAIDGNKIVAGAPNRPDGTVYTYTLQNSPDSADLGVTMVASHEAVGVTETLAYSVSVNNFSDIDATGVKVSLALPEVLKFNSSSDDRCAWEAGFVSCDLKNIPAQSTHEITVNTEAIEQGTASAQVTVNAYQTDPQPENNMVSINTQIEPEPFPRITFKSINNDDEITLTRYDALDIEFEIENWNFGEDGEAYWLLNNNEQETLHSAGVVNIGALKEDEYIFTIKLVDSDNRVFEGSVRFEIKEAPWPSAEITVPVDGGQFSAQSTIQIRYSLDYAGVAQNESDFILIVNGVTRGPLVEDERSLILHDLKPDKHHTVEIQYKNSKQPDAKVRFYVYDERDLAAGSDEQSQVGVNTASAGGGFSITLIALLLMRYFVILSAITVKSKLLHRSVDKLIFLLQGTR